MKSHQHHQKALRVNDLQGFFVFPVRRFRTSSIRFFLPPDPVPVQQAM
ncbi:hypothetical protein [Variovorax sp. V213]